MSRTRTRKDTLRSGLEVLEARRRRRAEGATSSTSPNACAGGLLALREVRDLLEHIGLLDKEKQA